MQLYPSFNTIKAMFVCSVSKDDLVMVGKLYLETENVLEILRFY